MTVEGMATPLSRHPLMPSTWALPPGPPPPPELEQIAAIARELSSTGLV